MKSEVFSVRDALNFDPHRYQVRACRMDWRSVTYRACEGIVRCAASVHPIQN